jgi:hypothetical protein
MPYMKQHYGVDVKLIVTRIMELKCHYLNTRQSHASVHLAAGKRNLVRELKGFHCTIVNKIIQSAVQVLICVFPFYRSHLWKKKPKTIWSVLPASLYINWVNFCEHQLRFYQVKWLCLLKNFREERWWPRPWVINSKSQRNKIKL